MKITIPKETFLEAVTSLAKVANGKSVKLNGHYVQLKTDISKQAASLIASDFSQVLKFDFPDAHVESNVDIAVSCVQLRSLVKGCRKDGDFTFAVSSDTLEVLDNDIAIGQLPLMSEEEVDFPICEIPKDAVMIILPTIFPEVVADAACCASKDPDRPMLQNICISKHGVASTDGRELYHVPLPLNPLSADLIVPLTPALASIKRRWLSLSTWLLEDCRFLAIRGENFTYLTKCEGGKFPNWPQVVPDENELDIELAFSSQACQQIKDFTSSVDTRLSEYVSLDYGQDKVTIKDAANRKIFLPADIKGVESPGSVSMKAEFLARMMKLGHNKLLLAPGEQKPMKATGGKGFYVFMGCVPDNPKNQSATEPVPEAKPVQTENPAQEVIAGKPAENHPQPKEISKSETTKITPSIQSPTTPKNPVITQQEKGVPTMEKSIPSPTAITASQSSPEKTEPEVTPIEEANQCLEGIRDDIKSISDRFNQAARKLKEALLQQRQKERQYFDAVKKLDRIRQASGF